MSESLTRTYVCNYCAAKVVQQVGEDGRSLFPEGWKAIVGQYSYSGDPLQFDPCETKHFCEKHRVIVTEIGE